MKPISDYPIYSRFAIRIDSKLCSAIRTILESRKLDLTVRRRAEDLMISYFNQSKTVVESYQGLFGLFLGLGPKEPRDIEEYNVRELTPERRIILLAQLFLVTIRSQVDLIVALTDLIMSNKVKMPIPGFNRTTKSTIKNTEPNKLVNEYADGEPTKWLERVNEIRNRLVHRGYHLGLTMEKQTTSLRLNLFDGINRISTDFPGIQTIDIAALFEQYLREVETIEGILAHDLLSKFGQEKITHTEFITFDNYQVTYSSSPV